MKHSRRRLILIAAGVFALSVLFPPWCIKYEANEIEFVGWAPIVIPGLKIVREYQPSAEEKAFDDSHNPLTGMFATPRIDEGVRKRRNQSWDEARSRLPKGKWEWRVKDDEITNASVEYGRLVLEWIGLAVITGLLWAASGREQ